ncbi:MAG: TRAP transporter substrate-binding protein [Reyranellaceae bacterium]
MKNRIAKAAIGIASGLLCCALASVAVAQSIALKAGHSAATTEPYQAGFDEMARVAKEKSGERLQIQVFPNSQLGQEKEMVEGLLLGTIDIANPTTAVLANFVPALKVLDLPFLFDDRTHMYRVLDGPIGEELGRAMLARGFRLLAWQEAGFRHIMTKKAINDMSDLKGLKIRTMQSPIHVSAFQAFGANPTPLAYGEVYGALQSGVVDGAEAGNSNYYAQRFFEVAPQWAMVSWTSLVIPVIMSEKRFQALPKDMQAVLVEAAKAGAVVERKAYADSETSRLADLQKAGVKVTKPDPEKFREAAKTVYAKFVTDPSDKKILDQIIAARQ